MGLTEVLLRKLSLIFCAMLCMALSSPLWAENFPLPEKLRPNVEFWKRVYTEIDGSQGFLHDDRNLGLVYKTINVPSNASRRSRKRVTNQQRDQLKKIIKAIAGKSADQLQGEARRIRLLFPKNASAKQIRARLRHIRFQLGQADKFEKAVQRSGAYTPYIRDELSRAGLPLELAALPYVESSFNIRANSHVGASGIWQFMPATGRRFMKVSHVIDERYDPFRASKAAISLLKYNYSILGSWPLALTAYNHGVGGMRRAVKKTGSRDMGVISERYRSRSFGFASRNFYAEFLAASEVSRHSQRYFPAVKALKPTDYVQFKLKDFVPAATLANTLGLSLSELKQHNLALREPVWDGEKHMPADYVLRVPKKSLRQNIDTLLAGIPTGARHKKQVLDRTYKVRRGDSLSRIAGIYGIKMKDLVAMNKLRSRHRIRIGQTLFLPQKGKPVMQAVVQPEPVRVASIKPVPVIKKPEPVTGRQPVIASEQEAESIIADTADILLEEEIQESIQQLLATDPAEYSVAKDNTIEIQAVETLGHYADWLSISTSQLRKINRLPYRRSLIIGKRLLLDFSRVCPQEFEGKRADYHKQLEDSFFASSQIAGTRSYSIRQGDSLWVIANKRTQAPLWLIRQHNPDIDFSRLKPGEKIVLPVIQEKKTG